MENQKNPKIEVPAESGKTEKIPATVAKVVVPKDPARAQGLRGLKGMVFGRFAQAYAKGKDLAKLPTQEEMTKEVTDHFPQSRWIANPKIHYSYYKSKFISSLNQ